MKLSVSSLLAVLLFVQVAAATDPSWFTGLSLLELFNNQVQSFPAPCDGYFITNAKITTFDPAIPSANRLRTIGNRIVWVGTSLLDYIIKVSDQIRPCKIINAQGRRLGPGIWDGHIHLLRASIEAGCQIYDAEQARNLNEFLGYIQAGLSKCGSDEIIAITGGFNQQSIGGEFPTREQLDAILPDQPFIGAQRYVVPNDSILFFEGPGFTNTAMRDLLNDAGFDLDEDGSIPSTKLNAIIRYLRTLQDDAKVEQQHKRLFAYLHRKGVIGGLDMAGSEFFPPDDYITVRKLYQRGELDMAIGIGVRGQAYPGGFATAAQWEISRFGSREGESDVLFNAGLGESFYPRTYFGNETLLTEAFQTIQNTKQKNEWALFINVEYTQDAPGAFAALQNVYASHGIPEYTWSIEHAYGFNETLLEWLAEKKIFLSVEGIRFLAGRAGEEFFCGPKLRTAMSLSPDPLISLNTDGRNAGCINWWISAQFWVDGKNATGHLINPDETISIYNVYKFGSYGNIRKVRQHNIRGTISPGKLADFVIWKDDPLTVPTSQIRFTEAKTTFFRGRIVFEQ